MSSPSNGVVEEGGEVRFSFELDKYNKNFLNRSNETVYSANWYWSKEPFALTSEDTGNRLLAFRFRAMEEDPSLRKRVWIQRAKGLFLPMVSHI